MRIRKEVKEVIIEAISILIGALFIGGGGVCTGVIVEGDLEA